MKEAPPAPQTTPAKPLQLTFCFDAITRPGPNPGETIITRRPNLSAECSIEYARQALGFLSKGPVRTLINQGEIKARRVGERKILVDVPSLYAYKEKGRMFPKNTLEKPGE